MCVLRGSAGGADTDPAAVCPLGVKLQWRAGGGGGGGGRCSDDVDVEAQREGGKTRAVGEEDGGQGGQGG